MTDGVAPGGNTAPSPSSPLGEGPGAAAPSAAPVHRGINAPGSGLILSLVLFVLAFGADRLHKYVQITILGWQGGEFVPVTPFFNYMLVWNTGVSYSLFASLPVAVLGGLMAVAIVALSVWWLRANAVLIRAGLALCIGGALSNALDRWVYGAVADFFHFHFEQYSFYVFNLADTAITFGVILLILDFLGVGRSKPA